MDRVEVKLRHERRDSPKGKVDHVSLELLLGGDLSAEQVSRLSEIADRCPVHRALTGEIVISHSAG